MKNIRNIREYPLLWGRVDSEKVTKLHNFVGELKSQLFIEGDEDSELTAEFLFNHGYGFEKGKKPGSFFGIMNAVQFRKRVLVNLDVLNQMIDIVTRPHIAVLNSPRVLTLDRLDDIKLETSQGHDFGKVESLQREWFSNPITRTILEYQKALETSFDEYNNQAVLNGIVNSHIIQPIAFLGSPDYKKITELSERINDAFDKDSYLELDSAYYCMGNRYMGNAGVLYKQLSESEFGKMFILSMDETRKGISAFSRYSGDE